MVPSQELLQMKEVAFGLVENEGDFSGILLGICLSSSKMLPLELKNFENRSLTFRGHN